MDVAIQFQGPVRGETSLPTDKAVVHRAVLLAAIAEGTTRLYPWPKAEDCQRTRAVIEACGVATRCEGDSLVVEGRGLHGLQAPQLPLECGESGTTLRLAAGWLAGQAFNSELRAAPTLMCRPMRRIVEPLRQLGAQITGQSGRVAQEIYPPLQIHGGQLLQGQLLRPAVASAQVKSAILLAGLYAQGETAVEERSATRDHTERMLRTFGLEVRGAGLCCTLKPGPLYSPGSLPLPGDISSAAFLIVAAACVPGSHLTLRDVGLNPTRCHFLRVLERMGAVMEITEKQKHGEPRGDITVVAGRLRGVTLPAEEVPLVIDEVPILMVAATQAQGCSRFLGLQELRVKETDRVHSMVTGLQALGARVDADQDTVMIEGGQPLHGAVVSSFGDHRTAMAFAVAGLLAQGPTHILGAECVAKSFPEFFAYLERLVPPGTLGR
jgi:3-phosphoshikimate 1-carboxyvinyltransferase